MRVLLDTNILISYLLTPKQTSPVLEVVTRGLLGDFTLLLPEDLLEEFWRKAREKKYLVERIAPTELRRFVEVLIEVSELVSRITEPIPAVTRDPKDDYLLAYALVGRADYLVTGDRDLLVLGTVGRLSIITAAGLIEILRERGRS